MNRVQRELHEETNRYLRTIALNLHTNNKELNRIGLILIEIERRLTK